ADLKVDADSDFVDDTATDMAKYGLDNPQLVAELSKDSMAEEAKDKDSASKDKSKETSKEEKKKVAFAEKVLIGSPVAEKEGKVYAKIADQNYVVSVSASVLADVNKQPNELRSHDLVEVTPPDVDYVSI